MSEIQDINARLGALAKALPEVAGGFRQLAKGAHAGSRFSGAQKELLAAAFGVVRGCEDCIVYHLDAAKKQGAEREDLVELLGIAVEMGGGPAMVYAAKALKTFDATS
ncbi:carboxymuconolactone decarboxylase family protein [Mangrovicella endophytica]|uniref:carboxymuconolactone decarboxylase family protein n=1 Tax=Mangrovicella endophytica TaxID=2066697 RepID=UPI000C9E15E3|nr:carboxymuconolactone decarboxylase family protein [Mangrovicella endophytica]